MQERRMNKAMNPKVTLMTPVYNAMPFFKEYLESVLKQTYRPLEFICVDDGSTDESYDYLLSMIPSFKRAGIELKFDTISHQDQSFAINHALSRVTGDYLTWCDADDELDSQSIVSQKNTTENMRICLMRCSETKATALPVLIC